MQRIADVMTRDVETVSPHATLQAAAQLMDELNVGALPVCDGKRLVGMLTDRDITVRATATGLAPKDAKVIDVMTEHTRWCTQDQSTDDVLQQMSDVQIRRIPVLDEREELVGIVSLGDLATRQDDDVLPTLRDISYPSEPDRSVV